MTNLAHLNWYLKVRERVHALNQITNQYELSFEQFLVLQQIELGRDSTPGSLACTLHTSMPAVSRKINLLQDKKIIKKEHNTTADQRIVKLKVTDKGEETYQSILAIMASEEAASIIS